MNNLQQKKILITGSNGFIGRWALDFFSKKSKKITATISRKTLKSNFKLLQKKYPNVDFLECDLLYLDDFMNVTKNQDMVLNFAALDGNSLYKKSHSATMLRVNSEIVLNLLEASRRNSVKKVLIVSSIEVYPVKENKPLKEIAQLFEKKVTNRSGYVWSKRFAEIAAQFYADEFGLKIVLPRVGNVYGPGDSLEKERVIPSFIHNALKGTDITIAGNGQHQKSFLYIADLMDAIVSLLEKNITGPVNIAGDKYISLNELAERIIKLTGSTSKIVRMDASTYHNERIINITKAKKMIGFKEKIDLSVGLSETINYFKNKLKIT